MLCVRCLCAFCVAALYCVLAGCLEEQTEEGQLSGVATRHAKKNKAQQRRTLFLHLPLTLNFTPAPNPPPSTLPPTPPPPNPPTPCKTRREQKTNETKFEFQNSEDFGTQTVYNALSHTNFKIFTILLRLSFIFFLSNTYS